MHIHLKYVFVQILKKVYQNIKACIYYGLHMSFLNSFSLVPHNVTIFGGKIFKEVIKV